MSDYRVFDTFQDAVLVIDDEGRVFYGNEAATLLFEVSARRLSSGKPLTQFVSFSPDPFEAAGPLVEVKEATQVKEVEFSASSGKAGWTQVSFQPQPDFFTNEPEEKNRWIVCLRDVSLEKTLHDKYKDELDQKEAVIQDLRVAQAKLEDYSRNLEKMVEARTQELREANQLLKTILDSLGQGILVFDSAGNCLPVFSQVCRAMFGVEPSGKPVEDVLQLEATDRATFASWREAVFAEMLDFDDLVPLAPGKFEHAKDKEIALGYNPMRDSDSRIQGVVVVATDRTREVEALREAARERELVRRVVQVARNRDSFRQFVGDTRILLEELRRPEDLDREELARRLHTIKGGASSFALGEIASLAHQLEETLKSTAESEEARLAFQTRLSEEAAHIGELLDKNIAALAELLGPLDENDGPEVVEVPVDRFLAWSQALMDATDLGDAHRVGQDILSECLERPLGDAIHHLEPSLKELAESLGKRLQGLEIVGGETRAPYQPLRPVMASLVHAFRNAIDHGLESPEDRLKAGKPEAGTIRIQFGIKDGPGLGASAVFADRAAGRSLAIEISDDGRGVDADRVRAKLIKLGKEDLASAADEEVIQAILRDDFSTAETVSEISGRGVGLSAIASEVRRLGGGIHVISKKGEGMRLMIRIPLPELLSVASVVAA